MHRVKKVRPIESFKITALVVEEFAADGVGVASEAIASRVHLPFRIHSRDRMAHLNTNGIGSGDCTNGSNKFGNRKHCKILNVKIKYGSGAGDRAAPKFGGRLVRITRLPLRETILTMLTTDLRDKW